MGMWTWVVVAFSVTAVVGCKPAKPELGAVACWGNGAGGQLGPTPEGRDALPVAVPGLDGAAQLYLGHDFSCARMPSGPLQCWGDMRGAIRSSVPRPLTAVGDAVEVRSSGLSVCARRASGAIACWGSNLVGELGNGKAPPNQLVQIELRDGEVRAPDVAGGNSDVPVAVTGIDDATQIAIGGSHGCALRRGGAVACWGLGDVGQLGDGRQGRNTISDLPVAVPGLTGVTSLVAGIRATCAIAQGAVWCWGSLSPQFGDFDKPPVVWAAPRRIEKLDGAVELAVAETEACARIGGGLVRCWGTTGEVVPRRVGGAMQLVAGDKHFCARLATREVACWGDNFNQQLGIANDTTAPQVVTVPGLDRVVDLAAGLRHTCALRAAR